MEILDLISKSQSWVQKSLKSSANTAVPTQFNCSLPQFFFLVFQLIPQIVQFSHCAGPLKLWRFVFSTSRFKFSSFLQETIANINMQLPVSQMQVPFWHCPWPEHCPGHTNLWNWPIMMSGSSGVPGFAWLASRL